MIKRLLLLTTLGVLLSGCYMVPMALIGPAKAGFSTASLIKSLPPATANYMIKKSTGKTIGQHVLDSIGDDIYKQTYLPEKQNPCILSNCTLSKANK